MDISFDLGVLNGRIYSPEGLRTIDLWIRNGRIAAFGGSHRAEDEIDARGLIVLPGAIDAHVHFRDPGQTHKEDWESGSISAAAGGVTTVIDQPNTDPKTLDLRSFELKLDLATNRSVVDFCINGGPGRIDELVSSGASAIGEIFYYEHSDSTMAGILDRVEKAGALPTVHAEDGGIIESQAEKLKGTKDPDVWSRARPEGAETAAIEKSLDKTKRVHICHLSTGKGLEILRSARVSGKKVSCEVTPHHLLFNRTDYRKQGSFLKMNPPLREAGDCDALWSGLRSGSIDILASDHAPHLPEEKKDDIWEASPGVPGVETMLPLMLVAVRSNLVSLDRLVDAISTRPAKIFGLGSKGSIEVGKDADLVLIDPKNVTRITADRLHSRSDWTPYEGRNGIFPRMTLVRGRVVFDGDIEVSPGFGVFQGKNFYESRT